MAAAIRQLQRYSPHDKTDLDSDVSFWEQMEGVVRGWRETHGASWALEYVTEIERQAKGIGTLSERVAVEEALEDGSFMVSVMHGLGVARVCIGAARRY